MLKNLFVDSYNHNLRVNRLLDRLFNLGFENPGDVFNFFPELINKPISFSNGEVWTLQKITSQLFQKKDDPSHIVKEYNYYFKNKEGKRCRWRSFFGGTLHKPQAAQRVIELYRDEFDREIYQRKEPFVLIEAAERACANLEANKNKAN